MSYHVQIIRPSDFLKVDGYGQIDLEYGTRVLQGLAKTCLNSKVNHVLLDVRTQYSDMTVEQLLQLVKAMHNMGFTDKQFIAILHRYRDGNRAELFAKFAETDGWNVRAFDLYEEAIEWFSDEEPTR